MPAFTNSFRRFSIDFKAKLPSGKKSVDERNALLPSDVRLDDDDDDDDADQVAMILRQARLQPAKPIRPLNDKRKDRNRGEQKQESSLFRESETLTLRPSAARETSSQNVGRRESDMFAPLSSHGAEPEHDVDTAITNAEPHDPESLHVSQTKEAPDGNNVKRTSQLEQLIALLPSELWMMIAEYLDPSAAASFGFANREMSHRIGPPLFRTLNLPENKAEKLSFLHHMQADLPSHVLCHQCAIFHVRLKAGSESLRESYQDRPLTRCERQSYIPAVRLSFDRALPFHLAKLAMHSARYGPSHGIPLKNLHRSWTPFMCEWASTTEWTHKTRFTIDKSQLLMKVTSTHFVGASLSKSEQRLALTCRYDYSANYTTCPHEAHGNMLFNVCKCALSHVPSNGAPIVPTQCATCLPLHRCVACPSEYLVEVKLKEHKDSNGPTPFRHAIVVTRWTNLGDCENPGSREWRHCSALQDLFDEDEVEVYRTEEVRTVRSRFEAATGGRPSQVSARILRRNAGWRVERELMKDDGRRIELFLRGY